jgi:outer membrane protein OmpA-like peptidoglycan-associated protein
MKKKPSFSLRSATAVAVSAAMLLSACANMKPGGATAAASCKPLNESSASGSSMGSRTQGALIGGAVGAVAGGLVGSQMTKKASTGARNGALLGAIGGALAGSVYAKSISTTEQADGSVKLNIPGKVMFGVGSSDISPEFKSTLDSVAGVVAEYCNVNARVVGYTDSSGEELANQQLSLRRATTVQQYISGVLQTKGVSGRQLSVEGLGEAQPIAPNTTEEGKAQNRRVEIFLIPPKS